MGLIGNVLAGLGNITGAGLAYKGQRETNKTNIALAEQARSHDVAMWNRQNAYNTPEMQMHRLKEAGLNPNLIYGTGQASTGNADAPKGSPIPQVSNELATFANNQAIQMLSAYQDWQVKKAQIKNIEAETQAKIYGNRYQEYLIPNYNILADSYVRKSRYDADRSHGLSLQNWQDAVTKQNQYWHDVKSGAFEARSKMPAEQLKYQQQAIEYLRKQARQKDLQIELDEQLKPYGMSTADQLWQRLLAPYFKSTAEGIINFMANPGKHFKDTFSRNKK